MIKNSRLWEVFEQLSGKEFRELEKSVHSPQFNNRTAVTHMFEYLANCRKNSKKTPSKIGFHQKYYPNEPYQDIRIRNAMSFLMKIIERYFVFRETEEDGLQVHLKLATVYRKKQLQKQYEQTLKSGNNYLKNRPFRNADYYSGRYQLEFEKYRSLSSQRKLNVMNLQSISDNLDISYLAQKLRQTCFSISHQTVYATEYKAGLLPYLLEAAAAKEYQKIPAIALYYHCYFSLIQPEEENHFQKFKELLFEYRTQFPKPELRDLYLLATNYCIKRMNKNAGQYAGKALALYKEGLKDEVLLPDGILPHITFSNIVTMSLVTGNYSFAENFIEKFKPNLSPEYREPIYSFNLARIRYQLGDFDEALPLLQREVYRDLLLNLSVKIITAKIFYETDEFDVLFSHLDAMQQFIRRKKVMGYHRENFQNFISLLRKIVELPSLRKEQKVVLKNEILEVNAVVERQWLLDQL